MKKIFYSLLFLVVLVQIAGGGECADGDKKESDVIKEIFSKRPEFVVKDSKDPNVLLKRTWDAMINVIECKDIDLKIKEKLIDKIVDPVFEFSLMSKLALGREHWSKFSEAQREKFVDLFVKRLRSSYRDKMLLYEGQEAKFKPGVQKKTGLEITMDLLSKEKGVSLVYKLREIEKRWKIYDVEIEGVSIVLTYRSQFDDVLGRGSAEDLLALLVKPPVEEKESKN